MSAKIDERYAFLASEEKHGLVSPLLSITLATRPNVGMLDLQWMFSVYGKDISTLSLLRDSPLSSPLIDDMEKVLLASWKFLNKVWKLRENLKNPVSIKEEEISPFCFHKQVAKMHSLLKYIEHDSSALAYQKLLILLNPAAPNFVREVIEYSKITR